MRAIFLTAGFLLAIGVPSFATGGPGGGTGPGGGHGANSCGYASYQERCNPASEDFRTKCKAVWGGGATCTLENCDGTTIELGTGGGPLYGCD